MNFQNLEALYKELFQLMSDLLARQYQAKNSCNSDDIDTAFQVLSYDNNLVKKYNKLNEKINDGLKAIQTKLKLSDEVIEETINNSSDTLMQSIKNMKETIEAKKEAIINERTAAIDLLIQKAGDLSKDIGDKSQFLNIT